MPTGSSHLLLSKTHKVIRMEMISKRMKGKMALESGLKDKQSSKNKARIGRKR